MLCATEQRVRARGPYSLYHSTYLAFLAGFYCSRIGIIVSSTENFILCLGWVFTFVPR